MIPKSEINSWITVENGEHVPIRNGMGIKESIEAHFSNAKNNNTKINSDDSLRKYEGITIPSWFANKEGIPDTINKQGFYADRETEKAVHLKNDYGSTWVPKSVLNSSNTTSFNARERAFSNNANIVNLAKQAGIQGVRHNMKLKNIVDKAKEQGKFEEISYLVNEKKIYTEKHIILINKLWHSFKSI